MQAASHKVSRLQKVILNLTVGMVGSRKFSGRSKCRIRVQVRSQRASFMAYLLECSA